MFDRDVVHQIKAAAIDAYPRELAGLVISGSFQGYPNEHPTPEAGFLIKPELFAEALLAGGVQAVIHSHPVLPDEAPRDFPSKVDMQQQIATALPWGLLTSDGQTAGEIVWFGDQAPVPPLVGRGFRHAVTDCYNLIRDAFRTQRSITLPEFPREWEWWTQGKDLYSENFARAGFTQIDPDRGLEPFDVFLVDIRNHGRPNHGGVYLGGGMGLHHLAARHPVDSRRLSVREPIGRWRNLITHWLRYSGERATP